MDAVKTVKGIADKAAVPIVVLGGIGTGLVGVGQGAMLVAVPFLIPVQIAVGASALYVGYKHVKK